jgi:hypothetical protein
VKSQKMGNRLKLNVVGIFILICFGILFLVYIFTQGMRYIKILPGIDEVSRPAWSPDGRLVAFECVTLTKEDIDSSSSAHSEGGFIHQAIQQICVANNDGTNIRTLTPERRMFYPSWSPNGRYLAWANDTKNIMIWDSTANQIETYSSNEILHDYIFFPWETLSWSLDGKSIFLQDMGFELDSETGFFQKHDLMENDRHVSSAIWSSDKKYLATVENSIPVKIGSDRLRIYQNKKLLFESEDSPDTSSLSWSHDATTIAWVSFDWYTSEAWTLHLTYAPTGETISVQLPKDILIVQRPAWSNDDTKIVFGSIGKIYWAELQTSLSPFSIKVQNIESVDVDDFWQDYPIVWLPTDQSVSYTTINWNIRIVNIDGTQKLLLNK